MAFARSSSTAAVQLAQKRVRQRHREQAATTVGIITIETRARFGNTAPSARPTTAGSGG
ncbi:hypothetical protein [Streptomyces sclerotialus]|uniref:hypothetical protein n=1 Tax=Streptomyces sclerotialus TaxID=1957 RepID=UPI003F5DB5CA